MDSAPTVRPATTARCAAPGATGSQVFRGIPYATRRALRAARARRRRGPVTSRPPTFGPIAPQVARRAVPARRPRAGRAVPVAQRVDARRRRGAAGRSWCGSTAGRSAPGPAPARSTRAPPLAARGDVVVVIASTTASALLGFLGHPDLAAERRARRRTGACSTASRRCAGCRHNGGGVRRRPRRRHDLRRVGGRRRRVAAVRDAGRPRACSTRRWCRAGRRSPSTHGPADRAGRASGRAAPACRASTALRDVPGRADLLAVQQQVEARAPTARSFPRSTAS